MTLEEEGFRIAETLRKLRADAGLSQVKLANRSKIDVRTIDAIEKGRIRNPSLSNLKKIAEALGLTLQNLFGAAESSSNRHFFMGSSPQGEFSLQYPRQKFRIIAYLPRSTEFFAGKLVLESKGRLDTPAVRFPGLVFVQIVFGKLEFILEGREMLLKEGQTMLFDGRLAYNLYNPLLRETTANLFAVPSFLRE